MLQIGDKVRVANKDEDYPLNGKIGVIVQVMSLIGACIDYRVDFDDIGIQMVNARNLEVYEETPLLKG